MLFLGSVINGCLMLWCPFSGGDEEAKVKRERNTFFWSFLAFDLYRLFCLVIRFFHPRDNGQWPPTPKDFYTRSYPLHFFLILILEKEPVFPFSMLSAKQGHYCYYFYNVFGPWLGIEPGTSHTRCQHSTTRLSTYNM